MCWWNFFWPSRPHSMYKNLLLVYTQRSIIPQPIYRTMSEGPSNALRFMSTIEVDGVTYTSPNTFSQKKKKKKNRTRRCQSCIGTHIKEDKRWRMSSHLWCLLHNDCKFVIYFIFLQRIGDYLFFFVKRSLDCEVERCLYVWMIIFICEADIFIAITIKIW